MRLLCLPHAGAGATSFTRWLSLFPPAIAPVRVQLPGREDATAEPALRHAHEAVDALLPQVERLVDTPVALYGHSMGALIAFELARALGAAGRPPVHLFVSGRRAPHLVSRRAPIHRLPDDAFAMELAAMGGLDGVRGLERITGTGGGSGRLPSFLRYVVRLTKADLYLSEEYRYRPGPGLDCPITAFYGTEDPVVDLDEVEAWRDHTAARFTIHALRGGHFFHQGSRAAITAHIAAALA